MTMISDPPQDSPTPDEDRPIRIVVVDDGAWFRSLMVQELARLGFDVVGEAGDGDEALRVIAAEQPDVAVMDVRMPPGRGDEGFEAAKAIRRSGLRTGVLLITAQPDITAATDFLDQHHGVGYWLKDSIGTAGLELADAICRIHAGALAIDPVICDELINRPRKSMLLNTLNDSQLTTLALMARGLSNRAIANEQFLSLRSVESNINQIFTKLGLEKTDGRHRRVIAVLIFLRHLR